MLKSTVKKVISKFDDIFDTDLYRTAQSLEKYWHNNNYFDNLRRIKDPLLVRLAYILGRGLRVPLNLHLGCGNRHIKGFINVDWRKNWCNGLCM